MIGVLQRAFRKSAPEEGEEATTIFHWVQNKRTWVYLGGFLFFSTVIHGAGFYLFQVVYPTPSRVEPSVGKIAVLDSGDPAIRNLLQRVEDRSIYFLPVSRGSDVRVELEDSLIPFSPSFGELPEDLRSPEYPWSLPFYYLKNGPGPESSSALNSRVALEREGDLSGRDFAPWSVFGDYIRRADWIPEIRVHLLVDLDGKVSVKEVDGELEELAKAELVGVIESTLRFEPSSEESKGWIRIFTRQN
ncbi:MAG: hypothetical protein P1U85_05095 [Verrucomicrobiales bacterium]|nr:hypothetical protein [Verrucomicrobiales bacterium]